MHPNAKLITDLYDAFDRGDAEAMAVLYDDSARFSDPVFTDLDADGARSMWKMLTEGADDLRVEASNIEADDARGRAQWQAWYTFSPTGRKVHNIIEATFEFQDGKILRHTDSFDFWRWTRHALGLPGVLLGWTPIIQNTVRSQAAKGLSKWRAEQE